MSMCKHSAAPAPARWPSSSANIISHSGPTQGRSQVLVHGGQIRPRLSVLDAQCRSPLGCGSRRPNRAKSRSYMAGHMLHIRRRLHILSNMHMAGYAAVMASPIAVLSELEDDLPGAVLGVRHRIHQRHRHAADCTLRDEGNLRSGMNVVALIRKDLVPLRRAGETLNW